MYKKSFILIVAMISSHVIYSGDYQTQSGYAPHHHHHNGNQHPHHVQTQTTTSQYNPAKEADERRLRALEQEEKEQYTHTNICWGGGIVGVIITGVGCFYGELKAIVGGLVVAAGFGGFGLFSMNNENYKAKQRTIERTAIIERLNKYNNTIIIK